MLWTITCMGVIVGLVGLSYRRLAALSQLASWAAPYLAGRGEWTRADAGSLELKRAMAELNEATLELGSKLEQPGYVPKSCAKVAFALGALLSLMQAIQVLGGAGLQTWATPFVSFSAGCFGAMACWLIGRTAEERARRLRDEWNTLIRRSTRDVAT